MLKRKLYPKTKRYNGDTPWVITEKLDGSNLTFFKGDGQLFIAQRNNVYALEEIDEIKQKMYKGLYGWLKEHGEQLQEALVEKSAIVGEWIGMGRIKYGETLPSKFLMFAKANVNEDVEMHNIIYKSDLFIYPFVEQTIPDFIGVVPEVNKTGEALTIPALDELYDWYTEKVGRDVEGFIITDGYKVDKYVRMKNGRLEGHRP